MNSIRTNRLLLTPFSEADFELLVSDILTDPRVITYYYSYQELTDIDKIRDKALEDFWKYFEKSRTDYGLEVWAARATEMNNQFIGYCALLHTELSDQYGAPEIWYMLAGDAQGKGFATELASIVMERAYALKLAEVIAVIDIPNIPSIRVAEKLGFTFESQIEAYGSTEMYLYRKSLS